jgi:hypothetical protein
MGNTVIRDGIVKTRKEHICYGCLKTINKGKTAQSVTYTYDGDIYTSYMCDICKDWCTNRNCRDCHDYETAHEGFIKECMNESEVQE